MLKKRRDLMRNFVLMCCVAIELYASSCRSRPADERLLRSETGTPPPTRAEFFGEGSRSETGTPPPTRAEFIGEGSVEAKQRYAVASGKFLDQKVDTLLYLDKNSPRWRAGIFDGNRAIHWHNFREGG